MATNPLGSFAVPGQSRFPVAQVDVDTNGVWTVSEMYRVLKARIDG